MPGRPHIFANAFTVDVPESAANTETEAFRVPGCVSEFPGQQITISGTLGVTCAASATAMTVRVRRSSLTGTLVGEAQVSAGNIAASKFSPIPFYAQDSGIECAGMDYVITFQGTAEGAAGAANGGAATVTIA